jgi:transcription termination factor Rho
MNLSEIKSLPMRELVHLAASYDVPDASNLRKQNLIFKILEAAADQGETIIGKGVMDF